MVLDTPGLVRQEVSRRPDTLFVGKATVKASSKSQKKSKGKGKPGKAAGKDRSSRRQPASSRRSRYAAESSEDFTDDTYYYYDEDDYFDDRHYRRNYRRTRSRGSRRPPPPLSYGYRYRTPLVVSTMIMMIAGAAFVVSSVFAPDLLSGICIGVGGATLGVAGAVGFRGAYLLSLAFLRAYNLWVIPLAQVVITAVYVVLIVQYQTSDVCKPPQDRRRVWVSDDDDVRAGKVSESDCKTEATVSFIVGCLVAAVWMWIQWYASRQTLVDLRDDEEAVGGGQRARPGDEMLAARVTAGDPLDETCNSEVESVDGIVDDRSVGGSSVCDGDDSDSDSDSSSS